jgi:hypothetical protein
MAERNGLLGRILLITAGAVLIIVPAFYAEGFGPVGQLLQRTDGAAEVVRGLRSMCWVFPEHYFVIGIFLLSIARRREQPIREYLPLLAAFPLVDGIVLWRRFGLFPEIWLLAAGVVLTLLASIVDRPPRKTA